MLRVESVYKGQRTKLHAALGGKLFSMHRVGKSGGATVRQEATEEAEDRSKATAAGRSKKAVSWKEDEGDDLELDGGPAEGLEEFREEDMLMPDAEPNAEDDEDAVGEEEGYGEGEEDVDEEGDDEDDNDNDENDDDDNDDE